ncbi:MAG: toprim domain-containing protein, partial [Pseudodesulfovibrio sp.]
MPKDLIIVESPAKVKTISKFLGKDYVVDASVGHVRDLPTRDLGVDEENAFAPQYEIIKGKEDVVKRLKAAAGKAGTVYLAPDPDREGEAIAWHVAELLRPVNDNIRRIQFNEITARAVKEALEHPQDLNADLFDSQQARRILDRLVGYKISPIL